MSKDLFGNDEKRLSLWEEWEDMPEYNNVNIKAPLITATFKFRCEEDYIEFKNIIQVAVFNGEKVFDGMQKKKAKQSWYPHNEKASKYLYIDGDCDES